MRRMILLMMALAGMTAVLAAQQRPNYDPATDTTVTGTVEDVVQVAHQGRGSGTHLKLNTAEGVIAVHVGPTRFLEQQKFTVFKGDEVTVVGSKVKNAVIARELRKGDAVLVLRDVQGVPKWSRGAARPN